MAEVNKKAAALNVKIAKCKEKLGKIDKQICEFKRTYKAVEKEIDELKEEARRLELEQLASTLEKNGFTANDIAAAIADGSIKKTAPAAEKAGNTEKEVAEDEAGGS